jgi:plastocyanin
MTAANRHPFIIAAVVLASLASACTKESGAPNAPPPEMAASKAVPSQATVSGKAPPASGGAAAIVVLAPRTPGSFPIPPEKGVMDQYQLTFSPDVLLIRKGQPVEFRNSDEVLHNVRVKESETRTPAFNVALPTDGAYTYTFQRDGFYDVGCDIHPAMAATILVTSTPYAVMADSDGGFAFSDVSPGSYDLTVYAGGRKMTRAVEVKESRVEVNITGP